MTDISTDPKEKITAVVTEQWMASNRMLLLSALGSLIGGTSLAQAKAEAGTLRKYIDLHLSDVLRLVPLPVHGVGVVPRAPTRTMSDAELAKLAPRTGEPGVGLEAPRMPVYYDSVWTSFSEPLETGRRFLEVNFDQVTRHDLDAVDDIPKSWHEVLNTDLPDFGSGEDLPTKTIADRIKAWAGHHGLNTSELRPAVASAKHPGSGPKTTDRRSIGRPDGGPEKDSVSALYEFLDGLDALELRSFKLSGDLLLSLIRRGQIK